MATTTKDFGLIGKKLGMTQVFDAEGDVVPVTVIQIAENIITDIKTKERDGYYALQLGAFKKRDTLLTKPERGNLQKKNLPSLSKLQEFRTNENIEGVNIGDAVNAEDFFKDLEKVNITSTSIGKGFQSGIKLYNMRVGRRSHGSKSKRIIGSLGAGTTPGRVFPGKRMPARMGDNVVTITKVKVVKYDPEQRLLLVKGPVSGKPGAVVSIKTSGVKSWNHNNKKAK